MPERQCYKCTMQKEWGCTARKVPSTEADPEAELDVETETFFRWIDPAEHSLELDGEETRACPRQHIHENPAFWNRLLLLYGMYGKGFLPEKGAILDQSHRLLKLFQVLDTTNAECDEQQREKQQRGKGNPFDPRNRR